MADIKSIADELVKMNTKEVNELAMVMKGEYGIEPAVCMGKYVEQKRNTETFSPKQYGMCLLNKKKKK